MSQQSNKLVFANALRTWASGWPVQERAGAEGEEVRRLTLSEIAYWLMGAGAVLVVLGIVAFAFSDDPA